MTRFRHLLAAFLLPVLLFVKLAMPLLHHRLGRLKTARASGDKGAISIELALAVIVVVGIAGAVLLLIKNLATKVEDKIPDDLPGAAQ